MVSTIVASLNGKQSASLISRPQRATKRTQIAVSTLHPELLDVESRIDIRINKRSERIEYA